VCAEIRLFMSSRVGLQSRSFDSDVLSTEKERVDATVNLLQITSSNRHFDE
jgi:hypothetical protein